MSNTQQNDIKALRTTLFETLRSLSDKDKPMEVDRAKAICETSQTIINSVKVEIDFAKASGMKINSEFIPTIEASKEESAGVFIPTTQRIAEKKLGTSNPEPGVTVHRIK